MAEVEEAGRACCTAGRGVRGGRGRGGQGQAPVIREDDSGGEDELARHAEQDQANGIVFTEDDEDHFLNLFTLQPQFHTRLFIKSIMTMISTASCEFSTVLQAAGGIFICQN